MAISVQQSRYSGAGNLNGIWLAIALIEKLKGLRGVFQMVLASLFFREIPNTQDSVLWAIVLINEELYNYLNIR